MQQSSREGKKPRTVGREHDKWDEWNKWNKWNEWACPCSGGFWAVPLIKQQHLHLQLRG